MRGDPAIQSLSQVRIEAGTQKEVLAAVQKSFGLSHSFQGVVTNQAQHPCSGGTCSSQVRLSAWEADALLNCAGPKPKFIVSANHFS
jgi:hypothetical protein